MPEAVPRQMLARVGALLFIASGLVTMATLMLPHTQGMDAPGMAVMGLLGVLTGIVGWCLPWHRWPREAGLTFVPIAFALIGLQNWFSGGDPYRFAIFFVMTSAWVGLAQRRWTMVWLSPAVAIAYALPLLVAEAPMWALSSVLYVVPVCVLIAESLGWFSARLASAQAALRVTEERFRLQYKHGPLPMYSWQRVGDDFILVDFNDAAVALSKHIPDSLGRKSRSLSTSAAEITASLERCFTEHCTIQSELQVRIDGTDRVMAATFVFVPHDMVTCYTEDITDRRQAERQLTDLAFRDALTGLPNRALFMDRVDHALQRTARSGEQVAVLFADLDNFKTVNDSLGHQAGDALLQAVAERLRSCLREADTPARLGGDEFTALLESISDQAEVVEIAERFLMALREPVELQGRELYVTASVGIALGVAGDRAEDVIRNADLALYGAKDGGKARYAVFDRGMQRRAVERLELESTLRSALDNGELRLLYQPIVSLESGQVVELEALVRWYQRDGHVLMPEEFIPLAEDTSLIMRIGDWVLHQACEDVRRWHELHADRAPVSLAVNLSARELLSPDVLEKVSAALATSGLAPHLLTLELAERAVMHDADAAIRSLQQLGELGVRLAIDDFGTGHLSLSYLKRFPVDMLKIDQSFVDGLGEEAQDTAIVRSVVALAQTLDLSLTAEGVETTQQETHLRALGCERAQGFLYAGPMPATDIVTLLSSHSRLDRAA